MQRQFLFLFLIMYQQNQVNEPSCCLRFVETVSLNLVSERFAPLSFFDIEDFKYTFILSHNTISQVMFNITGAI